MAHEITNTDGLVLTGKKAWHGLGTVVEDAPTAKDALRIAGLGWRVLSAPLQTDDGVSVPSHVVNIRQDTGDQLGVVGSGYKVLQNDSLAQVIEGLGSVDVESAGSLRGGRDVFYLVRSHSFDAAPEDPVHAYALFSNTHDGSRSFECLGTSVRVVCANTLRLAMKGSSIKLRHTAGLEQRISEAQSAFLRSRKQAEAFEARARALAVRPMGTEDVQAFFLDVYQGEYGKIPANPRTAQEERKRNKALRTVSAWLANMENPRNSMPSIKGTAWAALNSITEWSDRERTVRKTAANPTKEDARTFSNLMGTSADFKDKALSRALELV